MSPSSLHFTGIYIEFVLSSLSHVPEPLPITNCFLENSDELEIAATILFLYCEMTETTALEAVAEAATADIATALAATADIATALAATADIATALAATADNDCKPIKVELFMFA